nr:hypothetical protein [Boldiaceae sp.]
MFIGQTVKVVNLLYTGSPEITLWLGKTGIIRGLKFIKTGSILVVVEFTEYFRLWFFREELEPISQESNY